MSKESCCPYCYSTDCYGYCFKGGCGYYCEQANHIDNPDCPTYQERVRKGKEQREKIAREGKEDRERKSREEKSQLKCQKCKKELNDLEIKLSNSLCSSC